MLLTGSAGRSQPVSAVRANQQRQNELRQAKPDAPRTSDAGQRPVVPSNCSLRMSACPAWRAVSLVMCAKTQRSV